MEISTHKIKKVIVGKSRKMINKYYCTKMLIVDEEGRETQLTLFHEYEKLPLIKSKEWSL